MSNSGTDSLLVTFFEPVCLILTEVYLCLLVCISLPVYKAFALQIGQCCTELVGKQNESGQVQTVLPHLQERTQLYTEREK